MGNQESVSSKTPYLGKNESALFDSIYNMKSDDIKRALLLGIIDQKINKSNTNKIRNIIKNPKLKKFKNNKDWNKYIKAQNIFYIINQEYNINFSYELCQIIIDYSYGLYYLKINRYGLSIDNSDGYYDDLILKTNQMTIQMKLRHIQPLISGTHILIDIISIYIIFKVNILRKFVDIWIKKHKESKSNDINPFSSSKLCH